MSLIHSIAHLPIPLVTQAGSSADLVSVRSSPTASTRAHTHISLSHIQNSMALTKTETARLADDACNACIACLFVSTIVAIVLVGIVRALF